MDLEQFSLLLLGIIVLIIAYSMIGNLFEHKHIHILHETGVGILMGITFGIIIYYADNIKDIQFDQEIFFYGLLPPMIFAAGYNLKKKNFGKNLKYITLFGVLGTIITFGMMFGMIYAVNQMEWITIVKDNSTVILTTALIVKFSATISASDSVAALTIISSTKYPSLFAIVFGQGLVNDAVAIILFKVLAGVFDDADSDQSTGLILWEVIYKFFLNIIVSLLIGVVIGLFCSFIFKKMRFLSENPVAEVVITYLFGILSYVIAQAAEMSGVITVLVAGICLAHYNFYNLSPSGMHATTMTFQSISFIAEAIVFIYLGISTLHYLISQEFSWTFLGLATLFTFVGRFVAVFGLSLIAKIFVKKENWQVKWNELAIVYIAGMIRGSVAFALILTIENEEGGESDAASLIKSTTLVMVCTTTVILGALMPLFMKCFLDKKSVAQHQPLQQKQDNFESIVDQIIDEQQQEQSHKKKKGKLKNLQQDFIKPFFIYDYKERKQQISLYKKVMKFNSRGQYEGGNLMALVLAGARQTIISGYVDNLDKDGGQKDLVKRIIESRVSKKSLITMR